MRKPLWRHDVLVLVLGILSLGLVYWYESGALDAGQQRILLAIDAALVVYFLADWAMMWRDEGWTRRWFLRNSWRLLGMVPLLVASFAFLRLLRLARVVAVLDHIPPVRRGLAGLKRALDWRTLGPLAVAASSVTIVGALLVWLAERSANEALHEFSEALWWAIVTVTTVGYGDITPVTPMGRFVAVLLMVTGIGTIGMLASQVSAAIIRGKEQEIEEEVVAAAAPTSVAGQLSQLAALRDAGRLDEAEFAAAKGHVLGGVRP